MFNARTFPKDILIKDLNNNKFFFDCVSERRKYRFFCKRARNQPFLVLGEKVTLKKKGTKVRTAAVVTEVHIQLPDYTDMQTSIVCYSVVLETKLEIPPEYFQS